MRLVDGVNPKTVWTWNAIGKRRGAWMLKGDAPEAEKGFLLNHAISEFLPADANGRRHSNSDPVTGQAAWFDLRVRVTKCSAAEVGRRRAAIPLAEGAARHRAGAGGLAVRREFRRWREARQ